MKTIKVKSGQSFRSKLEGMGACEEGKSWVGRKSLRTFWATCSRGDWMLWLAFRVKVNPRPIVGAACECARLVIDRVAKTMLAPLAALELGERFAAGGRVKAESLRRAYFRSKGEAILQLNNRGVYATHAATCAVLAGLDHDGGWLACCYVEDVFEPDGMRARILAREKCADIVRKHIPFAVIEKAMKGAS